jgi:hypothetical protein
MKKESLLPTPNPAEDEDETDRGIISISIRRQETPPKDPARRKWLKRAAAAAAGAALAYERRHRIGEILEETLAPDNLARSIEEKRNHIRGRYGFAVTVGHISREELALEFREGSVSATYVTAEEPSLGQQRDGVNWLLHDLAKYPPECVRNFNLKEMRLVADLWHYMQRRDKEAFVDGRIGGISDKDKKFIALDVKTAFSLYSVDTWFAWHGLGAFVHELHHRADEELSPESDDEEWVKLNPHGWFDYVHDLAYVSDEYETGFATSRGRYAVYEDQAEVARVLMNEPARTVARAESDSVLAAKVAFIKRRYFEWSDGRMDEQYWKDLAAGKVDEAYWDTRK